MGPFFISCIMLLFVVTGEQTLQFTKRIEKYSECTSFGGCMVRGKARTFERCGRQCARVSFLQSVSRWQQSLLSRSLPQNENAIQSLRGARKAIMIKYVGINPLLSQRGAPHGNEFQRLLMWKNLHCINDSKQHLHLNISSRIFLILILLFVYSGLFSLLFTKNTNRT